MPDFPSTDRPRGPLPDAHPGADNTVRRPSATALGPSAPSCAHCADWARGYAAGAADGTTRAYQDGYAAGLTDGLAQGPAHPAVADSVARTFTGWDGAHAAHLRSIQTFKVWHNTNSRPRTESHAA